GKYNVPLRVLHSFQDGPGTLITLDEEYGSMEQPLVSGIAFNRDEAKVTVQAIPDTPGVASKILAPVGEANVEVDVIVQNVAANKSTDLTFTVHRNDMLKAHDILTPVANELGAEKIVTDDSVAKVSIVGVGMRSHAGVAAKMFKTLAEENINIQMITTSEIKISVIIQERYLELAVRCLHRAFELEKASIK
ncbi:MAG: ACT domain-containing protein, partial [Pseudomonadota bacterium]